MRCAAAAAAALGVEVGQIANSLVFEAVTGDAVAPLLVLTWGAHRVDPPTVAAAIGADEIRRAKPAFVRAATGQVIGGVAPLGHPAPLRTLVDTTWSDTPRSGPQAGSRRPCSRRRTPSSSPCRMGNPPTSRADTAPGVAIGRHGRHPVPHPVADRAELTAPWQAYTLLAGRVVGRLDQAEQLIADVEAKAAAATHPQFVGKSAIVAERFEPGILVARLPRDPARSC